MKKEAWGICDHIRRKAVLMFVTCKHATSGKSLDDFVKAWTSCNELDSGSEERNKTWLKIQEKW
jgi:hypothetical protein